MIYGGIEGGGTKWICAVGNGPDDLQAIVTVPTTTPVETIDRVAAFFALHPEFTYDKSRNELYGLTHHPLGWMRRER